jgi:DNA-binding NarL/FixJ family response regulator
VEPTRVLVGGMNRLLRGLVTEILSESPDIEVVGELASEDELEAVASRTAAEFVIVGLGDGDLPKAYLKALEARPRLRVLSLVGDARRAYLWQLRPERVPLGEVSPERLLTVLRSPSWREAHVHG